MMAELKTPSDAHFEFEGKVTGLLKPVVVVKDGQTTRLSIVLGFGGLTFEQSKALHDFFSRGEVRTLSWAKIEEGNCKVTVGFPLTIPEK